MNAAQIIYLRETLSLSQRDLARALGVAPVTVARWESGANQPTGLQLEVLRALHSSALTVANDATKRAMIAGLIGMGVGALLFWALTQPRAQATSDSPVEAPDGTIRPLRSLVEAYVVVFVPEDVAPYAGVFTERTPTVADGSKTFVACSTVGRTAEEAFNRVAKVYLERHADLARIAPLEIDG